MKYLMLSNWISSDSYDFVKRNRIQLQRFKQNLIDGKFNIDKMLSLIGYGCITLKSQHLGG
jgi:hypothetical protein